MPGAYVRTLARDRARLGFTVGQVAWHLGISPKEHRELEAGTRWPNSTTWERMRQLYGWP